MSILAQSWNVSVRFEDVPEAGLQFHLTADAGVRAKVARAAGIAALPRLEAHFDVKRHGRDGLHVAGSVSATVCQTCVVTLEPMENEVDEPVDLTFMPGAEAIAAHASEEGRGIHDPPETMVNGMIDLGAIATEFLILGVDPYPRKAGAVFSAPKSSEAGDHPFAALAALKKRS